MKRSAFLARQILNQSLLGSLVLVSSFSAIAQVEKDWKLEKKLSPFLGTTSCIASTSVAKSKVPVELIVDLPAGEDKAPVLILKAKGLGGKVAKAYVRPDRNTAHQMVLLNSDAASGIDTFVLKPFLISDVTYLIGNDRRLDIYLGEGRSAIHADISLKGSTLTINRQASCRDSKTLLRMDFVNELRKDSHLSAPVSGTASELLVSYQAAFEAYKERLKSEAALSQHMAGRGVLVSQKDSAERALSAAAQAETSTRNRIQQLATEISRLEQELSKARTELPGLETRRPGLVAEVDRSEKALDPFRSRLAELEQLVSSAQEMKDFAAREVQSSQSRLNSLSQQIRNLESEIDVNQHYIYSTQQEIRQLDNRWRNLEDAYRRFDVQREAQRILDRDSGYRLEQDRLARWINVERNNPSEIAQLEGQLRKAVSALEMCQQQKIAPAPDCSAEEAQVQRIGSQIQDKQNELNRASSEIREIRRTIDRFERNAERTALERRELIRRDIDDVRREISRHQDRIRSFENRISQIQSFELPSVRNQMAQEQSNLSQAESRLSRAQSEEARARQNLSAYQDQIGYGRLVSEIRAARSALSSLDSAISSAKRAIAQNPGAIVNAQTNKAQAEALLVSQVADREAKDQAAQVARQNLVSHEQQEASLKQDLQVRSETFAALRATTQGLSRGI